LRKKKAKLVKMITKVFSIGIAFVLIVLLLFLVLNTAQPAYSANLAALLAITSTPPPGEAIPLKPMTDITSLNAKVRIDVNGLIDGERAQGDLNAVLTTNDQQESKVTVTGSLLGEIAAQVGGSLLGLFTPSSVDIYKVPEGTYLVANSLIPICILPKADKIPEELEDVSPQNLLSMLTSSDVARGTQVGEGTLNGVAVNHYVLDGEAFLAAAQKSRDPKLRAFAKALWSAEDADLYVDAREGYPLAFNGSYSGEYDPLKFEGDFDLQVQLTGINTNTPVDLPAACNNPISP
jgi:hypothetical protein